MRRTCGPIWRSIWPPAPLVREKFRQDVADALQELHRQYMAGVADMRKDVQFILKATSLLMAGCLPASAAAAV